MSPKKAKQAVNVVDIASSDDDEDAGARPTRMLPLSAILSQQRSSNEITQPPPATDSKSLESRSFWKAGAYEVGLNLKPQPIDGALEHARVHPKFLHSNATSHKWAFGAIAELLDNAVDEIHNGATFVKVDKIDIIKDNSPALLFQDDGGGMDPSGIRKCMSLGYSSKKTNTTIGQYGNGFKTSTMRLGADVIVFSRSTRAGHATQSVGLLSYTFLRRTGQDDVVVPMIDFDISSHWAEPIIYGSHDDWSSNLQTILEWSPFSSKDELMQQFEDIGPHGTKVIIFNLWLNDEGIYELSFDDEEEDIRLRDEANRGLVKLHKKAAELQSHISYRLRYSLRAYASILYLRKFPNFNIILRGKPVDQFNVADDLRHSKVFIYKPQLPMASREFTVETNIGFIKEFPTLIVSGYNVYHKNRLIMPFWKVSPDGSSKGNGVVGILEANFIEPAHDKQDFERSTVFIRFETKLKQILHEYWKTHCHLVGYQFPGTSAQKIQKDLPVQNPAGRMAYKQNRVAANQYDTHLLVNPPQRMDVHQSIVCLPANTQADFTNGIQQQRELQQVSNEEVIPVVGLDGAASVSVDQICEENIQLFMKCEEHMQKETELKQMIEGLEKELKEAKNRYAQLSSYVETRKKQNIAK